MIQVGNKMIARQIFITYIQSSASVTLLEEKMLFANDKLSKTIPQHTIPQLHLLTSSDGSPTISEIPFVSSLTMSMLSLCRVLYYK